MLEIIVVKADDCLKLNNYNVGRVEFCTNMDQGGTTPDFLEVKKATQIADMEIHVMIRNNVETFTYSDEDITLMVEQIQKFNVLDIKGFVIGCNKGREINLKHLKLLRAATDKELTYHRAFDVLENKELQINILKAYVQTILTSGDNSKAFDSLEQLKALRNREVRILAGSGVDLSNAELLYKEVGAIHIGSALRVDKDFQNDLDDVKLQKLMECLFK